MPVSPARVAAFEILLKVQTEGAYASELLHSARLQKLSAADHGLSTELVMGVLRWRSKLDAEIARSSSQRLEKLDVEVLAALRLGTYQLAALIPGALLLASTAGARADTADRFIQTQENTAPSEVPELPQSVAAGGRRLPHRSV